MSAIFGALILNNDAKVTGKEADTDWLKRVVAIDGFSAGDFSLDQCLITSLRVRANTDICPSRSALSTFVTVDLRGIEIRSVFFFNYIDASIGEIPYRGRRSVVLFKSDEALHGSREFAELFSRGVFDPGTEDYSLEIMESRFPISYVERKYCDGKVSYTQEKIYSHAFYLENTDEFDEITDDIIHYIFSECNGVLK